MLREGSSSATGADGCSGQIGDHDQLLVAWLARADPARREAELIGAFEAEHGRLPFANFRRGQAA
jgi:hypothetical protein